MTSASRWNGQAARRLRHALGLTVHDFAENLGVSPRTVSSWERAGTSHAPRPGVRRTLDVMLERSSEDLQSRFHRSRPDLSPANVLSSGGQTACGCGTRLTRDNEDGRCGRCATSDREAVSAGSVTLPSQFWNDPDIQQALRARHMGHILRSYRLHPYHRNSLSQEVIAGWAGITQAQVSRIENGPPMVHIDRLTYWAGLLGIPAEHLWFALPGGGLCGSTSRNNFGPPPALESENPGREAVLATAGSDTQPDMAISEEVEDVRRRDLLNLLGGTASLALGSDFGEGTRLGLERFLSSDITGRDLDEWERSIDVYGVEIGSAPPTLMLQHLIADIHEVNGLLGGRIPSMVQRRLLRVATQLSVLTAVTVIATGAPQAGRRWWRTARRTADQLGDAELDTFVLGQQAILAMYCGYSQEQVLDLADEALSASGRDLLCVGAASATAAKAQSLSVLGRDDEARKAVDRLRDLVDRLPDSSTNASATWFCYPEYKLRHVESYVNTRLGRTREAVSAQDTAARLYPRGKYRGLSQVELHRAACMIMDGYVDEGIHHATSTLQALPVNLRSDGLIHNVANVVVSAVPSPVQSASPVMDLRELLSVTRSA